MDKNFFNGNFNLNRESKNTIDSNEVRIVPFEDKIMEDYRRLRDLEIQNEVKKEILLENIAERLQDIEQHTNEANTLNRENNLQLRNHVALLKAIISLIERDTELKKEILDKLAEDKTIFVKIRDLFYSKGVSISVDKIAEMFPELLSAVLESIKKIQ